MYDAFGCAVLEKKDGADALMRVWDGWDCIEEYANDGEEWSETPTKSSK